MKVSLSFGSIRQYDCLFVTLDFSHSRDARELAVVPKKERY